MQKVIISPPHISDFATEYNRQKTFKSNYIANGLGFHTSADGVFQNGTNETSSQKATKAIAGAI